MDQHGRVLDILVQSRRNAKAAKRFFRKLLKGLQYVPRVIVTDKLRIYAAVKREIMPGVSTGKAAISTTGPRCRTNRRDNENGKCNDTALPRKDELSVGVARQCCGQLEGATAFTGKPGLSAPHPFQVEAVLPERVDVGVQQRRGAGQVLVCDHVPLCA